MMHAPALHVEWMNDFHLEVDIGQYSDDASIWHELAEDDQGLARAQVGGVSDRPQRAPSDIFTLVLPALATVSTIFIIARSSGSVSTWLLASGTSYTAQCVATVFAASLTTKSPKHSSRELHAGLQRSALRSDDTVQPKSCGQR